MWFDVFGEHDRQVELEAGDPPHDPDAVQDCRIDLAECTEHDLAPAKRHAACRMEARRSLVRHELGPDPERI